MFILILLLSFLSAHAESPFRNLSNDGFNNLCKEAYRLNDANKIPSAYKLFADQGDKYAVAAEKIFDAENITMERCVIEAHWLNVIGQEKKNAYFNAYGIYYQKSYINFVCKNRRLPKSDEIENLYGQALKDMHLPDALSIDKVLNRQVRSTKFRKLQHLGTMGIKQSLNIGAEWYDAIGLDKERRSTRQNKADISEDEANNLAMWTTMRTISVCAELGARSSYDFTIDKISDAFHFMEKLFTPYNYDCPSNR